MVTRSLVCNINIPSPHQKGWIVNGDEMKTDWMFRDPAPADVLQLLCCNCKTSQCVNGLCLCRSHGLPCTDLCHCNNCQNKVKEDEQTNSSDEGTEDDSDSDFEE